MIFYKSCPKCAGDMHHSSDQYGDYRYCLNCGLYKDIKMSALYEVDVVRYRRFLRDIERMRSGGSALAGIKGKAEEATRDQYGVKGEAPDEDYGRSGTRHLPPVSYARHS